MAAEYNCKLPTNGLLLLVEDTRHCLIVDFVDNSQLKSCFIFFWAMPQPSYRPVKLY